MPLKPSEDSATADGGLAARREAKELLLASWLRRKRFVLSYFKVYDVLLSHKTEL